MRALPSMLATLAIFSIPVATALAAPVSNFRLEILPSLFAPSSAPSTIGGTRVTNDGWIHVFGQAYGPRAVRLFVDGTSFSSTRADDGGRFDFSMQSFGEGVYVIGVQSEDSMGQPTTLTTAIATLLPEQVLDVGSLLIPPTLSASITDTQIVMTGEAPPSSTVIIASWRHNILINSYRAQTNAQGRYQITAPAPQDTEAITLIPIARIGTNESGPGRLVRLSQEEAPVCGPMGDINGDCQVNLVDYSIAVFWYDKTLSKDMFATEATALNGDGRVDLIDFSFIGYYWNP